MWLTTTIAILFLEAFLYLLVFLPGVSPDEYSGTHHLPIFAREVLFTLSVLIYDIVVTMGQFGDALRLTFDPSGYQLFDHQRLYGAEAFGSALLCMVVLIPLWAFAPWAARMTQGAQNRPAAFLRTFYGAGLALLLWVGIGLTCGEVPRRDDLRQASNQSELEGSGHLGLPVATEFPVLKDSLTPL